MTLNLIAAAHHIYRLAAHVGHLVAAVIMVGRQVQAWQSLKFTVHQPAYVTSFTHYFTFDIIIKLFPLDDASCLFKKYHVADSINPDDYGTKPLFDEDSESSSLLKRTDCCVIAH